MCVGSNLAMLEMKNLVATVWSNYATSVVNDAGMIHEGGYMAGPVGASDGTYLLLRFEKLVGADA